MSEEKLPISEEDQDKIAALLKEMWRDDLDDEPFDILGKMLNSGQIIQELEDHTEWAKLFMESILDTLELSDILELDEEDFEKAIEIMDRAKKYG